MLVSESIHEVHRERSCLWPDAFFRIFPVPEERLQILLCPVQPPGQSVQLPLTQLDRDPVYSISLLSVVGLQGAKGKIKRLRSERCPAQFEDFSGKRHTPRMDAVGLERQRPAERLWAGVSHDRVKAVVDLHQCGPYGVSKIVCASADESQP